jgi:phage terminase large subunit
MAAQTLRHKFPRKLGWLISEQHRYRVLYGGRGGAKSWGIARALLLLGVTKSLRILCARELQNSIQDSVHRLLADQIAAMGLADEYEIQRSTIIGRNGTTFGFEGLRHNITSIKSYEGADICWVEEAQTVSKASWDVLIPTIRKPGSEIWVSFNPELDTDETYKRFVLNPPATAKVVKIGWQDNPWFPDVLDAERKDLEQRDPDAYLTVWEGHCRQTLDGAVYAAEIRKATEEQRITRVPYDATKPVHTFWDIGWSDSTSIWFAQQIAYEYRLIDFHQDQQKTIPHYLQVLQNRGYVYGTDYLPHDAQAKTIISGGRSMQQMLQEAGRRVDIVPNTGVAEGINAARTLFSQCVFDEIKCADGLNALRRYRYDVDAETGQWSKKPLHDANSHAADAFRYFALSIRQTDKKRRSADAEMNWMG